MSRPKHKISDDTNAVDREMKKKFTQSNIAASNKSDWYEERTQFRHILSKCGLKLSNSMEQACVLSVQSVAFVKAMAAELDGSSKTSLRDDFYDGFRRYANDKDRFQISLMPTQVVLDENEKLEKSRVTYFLHPNLEALNDDSVIRLLMKVDVLQTRVSEEVLEKLSKILKITHLNDLTLPRLILNQFRFLEHIVDGEVLCQKFMEFVKISKGQIQLEILESLPELAEDSQQELVASNLRDFIKDSKDLVVPTLDTIGKLSLRSELLSEIRSTAILMLNEYDVKDVPVVVKFLFSTVSTPSDVEKLLNEIRENFEISRIFVNMDVGSKSPQEIDTSCELVSILETFLKYQKHILDGVLRYLESLLSNPDLNVFDFVLLVILLNTARKKSSIMLIKQMIRNDGLNEDILRKCCKNVSFIKAYFKPVCELCESLVRSLEHAINNFGCVFYRLCFAQLDDFSRQEIVSALVTHVTSGCDVECNSALNTLEILVNSFPKEFCPFSIFIKNLLEYLSLLKFEQVRGVFSLLASLAAVEDPESDSLMDDLNIIIRKNMTRGSLRQRSNAVLCSVMLFKSLSLQKDKRQFGEELLSYAIKHTSQCNSTRALLWEELANVIETCKVDSSTLTSLKETSFGLFEKTFVCKNAEELRKLSEHQEISFGFADNVKRRMAIRISALPLESNSKDSSEQSAPAVALAPLFRLVSICHLLLKNGLSAVQDVLESPIITVPKSVFQENNFKLGDDKTSICKILFFTCNWIRELLNAFSQLKDDKMNRICLIRRLKDLVLLQKCLEKRLTQMTVFVIPVPIYYENEINPPTIKNAIAAQPKKKAEKGRVMKKKKADETVTKATQLTANPTPCTSSSTSPLSEQAGPSGSKSVAKSLPETVVLIKHYYRELDISIMNLLLCNLELTESNDTQDALNCDELLLLLEDLNEKLKTALPPSAKRTFGFLKNASFKRTECRRLNKLTESSLVSKICIFVPALFKHLEVCQTYFKSVIEENDGIIDSPAMWSSRSLSVSRCVDLLFNCLYILLNWNGHSQTSNKSLTKELFKNIASVTAPGETATVNSIADASVEYFLQFVDIVSNLHSLSNLVTLLSTFTEFGASAESKQKISEIALSCLKREWSGENGSPLKGAKVASIIKNLLQVSCLNAKDNTLTFVENIVQTALSEACTEDSFCSNTFKTISKTTFGAWYDGLFSALLMASQKIDSNEDSNSQESRFLSWIQAARLFTFLSSILKKVEQRSIFSSALQHGNSFVKIFIKNGMTILDRHFTDSSDDIRRLLSSMQTGTRLLQTLCTHSKIMSKDKTLTKYVPPLKKTLEEFVYRVKAMMALNNCQTALTIGILKTKTLRGDVISSQLLNEQNEEDQSTNADVTVENAENDDEKPDMNLESPDGSTVDETGFHDNEDEAEDMDALSAVSDSY